MTRSGARSAPGGGRGHPWLVQVASLRRQVGASRPVSVRAPIEELSVTSAAVPEGAEVSFEGQVEAASGGVVVVGRVRAPWEGICRRCLSEARGLIDVEIRELASDDPDPESGYPLTVEWLDLEPIVHDACILELPLAPLCLDDCQGLCSGCGANRNREACSCEETTDPRWAALAGLSGGGEAPEQHERQSAGPDRVPAPDEDEPDRRTG